MSIKLKHSTTLNQVPASLADGEVAINRRDAKLFWKDHQGIIQSKTLLPESSGSSGVTDGDKGDVLVAGNSWFVESVAGGFAYLGAQSINITSNQNNLAFNTGVVRLRLSSDAERTITGFAGGIDGRVLLVTNVGTNNIIFSNEDALSTASNRFGLSRTITMFPGEGLYFHYGTVVNRWRLDSKQSLNGEALVAGTVAAARLGSGTPSASTVLMGNSTWTASTNVDTTSIQANDTLFWNGSMFVPRRGERITVLASDVTNNNATLNTIADVTGLFFAVTAGVTYRFRFQVVYTAQAGTTGSRWSITGPAITLLSYRSEYALTATSRTVNEGLNAYDLPAASNATTPSTNASGNIAIVEGIVRTSANGNIQLRFASEVASSAIVAKGGYSFVEYQII